MSDATDTRIIADIDYEPQGRRVGYLRVPNATNESAWGVVSVPVTIVQNGTGPTVLLTGGVHGDEYEGQIALHELARQLDPQAIAGRVIVIPALHYPAAQAGTRLSPIDGRDLNRAFPGAVDGSFAQALAHYVTSHVLPLADVHIDLHSGGRSLNCLPCTMSHLVDDAEERSRTAALARAFGAPYHVMNREVDGSRTVQAIGRSAGVLSLSSELGGCNSVSLTGLAIARQGVDNVLRYCDVVKGESEPFAEETRFMQIPDRASYGFSPADGIFCPVAELGAQVTAGETAGFIYDLSDLERVPVEIRHGRDGLLWCRRGQGRIEAGDSAVVVGCSLEEP